ncbi:hypothetical protein PRIPAC_73823, partial [Pristionchus pacificus]
MCISTQLSDLTTSETSGKSTNDNDNDKDEETDEHSDYYVDDCTCVFPPPLVHHIFPLSHLMLFVFQPRFPFFYFI